MTAPAAAEACPAPEAGITHDPCPGVVPLAAIPVMGGRRARFTSGGRTGEGRPPLP